MTRLRRKAVLAALLALGVGDWLIVNLAVGPAVFAARAAPSAPAAPEPPAAVRTAPATAPSTGHGAPAAPSSVEREPEAASMPTPVDSSADLPAAPPPAARPAAAEAPRGPPTPTTTQRPPRIETAAPSAATLRFQVQSAALTRESATALRELARELRENPDKTVLIEGHADERGPEDLNQWLSEQRAESAKRYLLGLGVEERRVEAVGRGASRPRDTSGTGEGLARNRRVEVTVR